jgi:hypothetical protein
MASCLHNDPATTTWSAPSDGLRCAAATAPIEHELVIVELEAAGDECADPLGAAGDFEHALADAAAEVVVVLRAGGLVSGRFARQGDRDSHAFGDERLERPIHGRGSEPGHLGLGTGEDLAWRERAPLALDGADNGGALSRGSFHGLDEG